ncbi:hypothetical protein ZIOFF_001469 [Zingiber officinale]|uniref:Uncharacterized protein n=1 Tax=Zingiber officinale TaxID=94328 RepID=A0A8J5I5X7_ZINOF|nr:hypothetical protein ZIOFF_001469 [Zingiber officinale]
MSKHPMTLEIYCPKIEPRCFAPSLHLTCAVLLDLAWMDLLPTLSTEVGTPSATIHTLYYIRRHPEAVSMEDGASDPFELLVDALCKEGHTKKLHKAKKLWNQMRKEGVTPMVVIYGTLIEGLFKEALGMLEKFPLYGVSPNISTVNSLVKGFYRSGNLLAPVKLEEVSLEFENMVANQATFPLDSTATLELMDLAIISWTVLFIVSLLEGTSWRPLTISLGLRPRHRSSFAWATPDELFDFVTLCKNRRTMGSNLGEGFNAIVLCVKSTFANAPLFFFSYLPPGKRPFNVMLVETLLFKLEILDHKARERAGIITPTFSSPVPVYLQLDAAAEPPPPINDTNPYNVFRPREKAHRLHPRRVRRSLNHAKRVVGALIQREEKKHDLIECEINLQRLQLKYKHEAKLIEDRIMLSVLQQGSCKFASSGDDYSYSDDTENDNPHAGPAYFHCKKVDSKHLMVPSAQIKPELKIRHVSNRWLQMRDYDEPMLLFTRPLDPTRLAALGIKLPPCPPSEDGLIVPAFRFHSRVGRGGRIIFDREPVRQVSG